MKENIIEKKSFDFALEIIKLYQLLIKEKEFTISKQLLRSGTSIGANVQESISAQSKKDFINKMSLSLKEARETRYWLLLLKKSTLTSIDIGGMLSSVDELIKIMYSIINTSRKSL
jgi:four helix bundle protein